MRADHERMEVTSGPIDCDACSATIIEAVTTRGVKSVEGEEIPFRRATDYVMCPSCFAVYAVRDLMKRVAHPEPPASDDDVIAHLERLAERTPPPS